MTWRLVRGYYHVTDPDGGKWGFPAPGSVYAKDTPFDYLLAVCPSTRLACKKLATMRRVLRERAASPPLPKEPTP